MRKATNRRGSVTRPTRGRFSDRLSNTAAKGQHKSFRVDPAFFGLVIDSLAEYAVITMDRDLAISSWNPAARRIFGYTDDEIIGSSVAPLFTDEDRSKGYPKREFDEALIKGRVEDERYHLAKERRLFWSYGLSFPLKDAKGDVRGYVKIVRDETERKRSEDALRAARITADAANKQLQAFSYTVAHDLKAPLRTITSYSQLVMNEGTGRLDKKHTEYLESVVAACARMRSIIEGLLRLAQLAHQELRPARANLSEMATTIATELRKSNPERDIQFEIKEGLSPIGDSELLYIVIQNLLDNAVKFTGHQKHARIEVGARQVGKETAYFIKDNGTGFDMSQADKLFMPFQRLHRPEEFPGTGLGLASIHRIIQRHGGRLWAEAVVGAGATFYFTLGPQLVEVKAA
jgi:PAS domain S-box-containing protein